MKIYKVPIYKINYGKLNFGEIEFIDHIIVKKNLIGISEVLTEFDDIDIVDNKLGKPQKKANPNIWRYKKFNEFGYHFIIYKNDFIPKNIVTSKEIDKYLEKYDESSWKREYERIKHITKKEKEKINQRIKSIYGTKK